MASCININSVEYQTLKKKSGLSDFELLAQCRPFLDKYDRFPYVDELAESNSEPDLKESLEMTDTSASIDQILRATGTKSIKEANIVLNNDYRDLEVTLIPLKTTAHVEIEHRPSRFYNEYKDIVEFDKNVNSTVLLNQTINKLARLYGVGIIPISTSELMSEEWKDKVPDAKHTSAFVYNGNIYINTEVADIDAPLHEMMHLFLGSIRFTNSELYQSLLSQVNNFEDYPLMIKQFADRTRNDINEEILVEEFSKYLTGFPSKFDGLDESTKYNLFYDLTRVFDSVLMGQFSVNNVNKTELGNMTLRDLAKKVKSSILTNNFKGSLDDNTLHRIEMNTKAALMREHRLEEFCS